MSPVFLTTPLVLPVWDIMGAWGILPDWFAEVLIVREKLWSVSITSGEWSVGKKDWFAMFATVSCLPSLFMRPFDCSGTVRDNWRLCVGVGAGVLIFM
jgi:hypothetical protein